MNSLPMLVIMVRHFEPDYNVPSNDPPLLEGSINRAGVLTECIKRYTSGMTVAIVTSPKMRAYQTAQVIRKGYAAKRPEVDFLWSNGEDRAPQPKLLFDLLREMAGHHYQAVVVVTHYEWVYEFPVHFGARILGVTLEPTSYAPGSATIINCVTKTCVSIN